jgi:1,4-dihydroxy-2-naphthoate polyprenyltransferase
MTTGPRPGRSDATARETAGWSAATGPGRPVRQSSGFRRWRAFAALGKARLVELWLGPVVAWSASGAPGQGRTLTLGVLFFIWAMTGMSATHALDDVNGYRDGSDAVNYAPERRRSQRKPLVEGEITLAGALVFAGACAGVAAIAALAASAVAGWHPRWLLAASLVTLILSLQYSIGLKLSYRLPAGGEALLVGALAASVLIPFAGMTGAMTRAAVVEAVIFAVWFLQVAVCSNTTDARTDREAGRRTVAAMSSASRNKLFVAAVVSAGWALALAATALGLISWLVVICLLPAWALQAWVLYQALGRDRWRFRRNLSFLAARLGIAGLIAANLLLASFGPRGIGHP